MLVFLRKLFLLGMLFISINIHSNPKKIVLDHYTNLPFEYVNSEDEFMQVKVGLFVREISINVLNKFLEDFSKNLQEKDGYIIIINFVNSNGIKIEIPFAIHQSLLNSLIKSKDDFQKICNIIINDSYEWIIRNI